jgi:FkbM family methyltransferase
MAVMWYDRDWKALSELELLGRGKLRPGARVFDLGAHQCVVAMILARLVGPTGAVVAVDPVPHNISVANQNRCLNNLENLFIRRAAISSANGKVRFTSTSNGHISSSGFEVECRSLDALVQEYGKPDVIFMDVEGHECHALDGGKHTLALDIDWFIEVHVGCGLEAAGGSAQQLIEQFRSAGYYIFLKTDDVESAPFQPLDSLPNHRFFLVASRSELL